MNCEEANIQKAIVQWLQLWKYWFCSIPNELGGKDAAIRTARAKTLGLRSGAPDMLVFLNNGKLVCLEIKTPTGKQSDAQVNFQLRLEKCGHEYHVVRSLDDAIQIFKGGERR